MIYDESFLLLKNRRKAVEIPRGMKKEISISAGKDTIINNRDKGF